MAEPCLSGNLPFEIDNWTRGKTKLVQYGATDAEVAAKIKEHPDWDVQYKDGHPVSKLRIGILAFPPVNWLADLGCWIRKQQELINA